MDTDIQCPVCYSKVSVVNERLVRSSNRQRLSARDTRLDPSSKDGQDADDDEIMKLAPLLDEETEAESRASHEVQPVSAATGVAGQSMHPAHDGPVTEGRSSSIPAPASDDDDQLATKKMTRRERYEAARRRLEERHTVSKPLKKRRQASPVNQPDSEPTGDFTRTSPAKPMPEVSLDEDDGTTGSLLHQVFSSEGLIGRFVFTTLLLGGSNGLMHYLANRASRVAGEASFGERLYDWLIWIGAGALPFLLGTALLYLLCGYVFRETASGNTRVSSWKIGSLAELNSTFWVFGFGFFIAGLPLLPIPGMFPFVLPFQFFIAPLLLLSAWYSENPLSIIAVDAFQNFKREMVKWGDFYKSVTGLAFLGFLGGLLMMVPWFPFFILTSMMGAFAIVFTTVAFAALTGRHCGEVVNAGASKLR